jgi:hypothetical protein
MELPLLRKAAPCDEMAVHRILTSRWLMLTLMALGTAARCRQYLGCPSYWYDEAYLLLNIFERSCRELIGPLQYNLVIPPLFLWTLRGLYSLAGASEWVMRLPAAITGLASLFLMIPLARRVVGLPAWLWAVALCALSDHHLMHACEVRPYASDFLITESILLASGALLMPSPVPRAGAGPIACLIFLALVAPWLSFPSVFVLAAAGLALLLGAVRRQTRTLWITWLALSGLSLLSALALWEVSARHLYYPGLREHWTQGWHGFPDSSSWGAVLKWLVDCLIDIGDYGTRGMGIPLLLLAGMGLAVLWARSRPLVVLLAGPIVLAGAAAFLRSYPMGDRTLFFAVPCIWLLAASGLELLMQRLPRRLAWVGLLGAAAVIAPGALDMAQSLFVVTPKVEFREAFAYVHHHWREGDTLWVSHPEVYEVYFGTDTHVLGYATPFEEVERIAARGRLWSGALPSYWPDCTRHNVLSFTVTSACA